MVILQLVGEENLNLDALDLYWRQWFEEKPSTFMEPQNALKNKGSLLTSMVPRRSFNIHRTLLSLLYSGKTFFRLSNVFHTGEKCF